MSRSMVFQFSSGKSLFHSFDPLTKLTWLVSISLLAFGAYIAWVQIVIAVAVLLTALLLARLSPAEILRGTWIFVIACASFFLIQTLSLPASGAAFRVFDYPIYAASADYALASALRIYTIVLSSLVFVRTTDPRELAIALVTQLRIPYRIAYAFFIALRIIRQ
jgi:energy-coupling factor transport system permease protein